MLIVKTSRKRKVVLASDQVVLVHNEDAEAAVIVMADGSVIHAREPARHISIRLARLRLLRLEVRRGSLKE